MVEPVGLAYQEQVRMIREGFINSLEDPVQGPLIVAALEAAGFTGGGGTGTPAELAAAMIVVFEGPQAPAVVDAMMTAMAAAPTVDKTAWLDAMFGTEVIQVPTAAAVRSGSTAYSGIPPDILAAAFAPGTLTAASGVIAPNGANAMLFRHTLTANVVDCNPINLIPGVGYPVEFTQGGSGGYTIAFGLNTGGNREVGIPSPAIDTEVGRIAYYTIINIGTVGSPIYRVLPGAADA